MTTTEYGTLTLDVLVGAGVFLIGLGVFVGMLALARELSRFRASLDEVTKQIQSLREPVTNTLAQVDKVTTSVGGTADAVSKTVELTRTAVTPAIVNLGAVIGGVSAGLRRLVTGKDRTTRE